MEEQYKELRRGKVKVEEHAKTLDRMVEQIVNKYSRELTKEIEDLKATIMKKDALSDDELEKLVIRIPVFMYYAVNGVETLGIESDMARQIRQEVYATKYLLADGTVKEKESQANVDSLNEQLIEIAFSRAYKKLKLQLEKADAIFTGVKKVLSRRIQTIGTHLGDKND